MYYAITFTEETKNKLLKVFNKFFGEIEVWKIYCDHITLIHSSHKDWDTVSKILLNFVGHNVTFSIIGIGFSPYATAFLVDTRTANKYSHITIAVAPGHKPVESNNIEKWENLYCDADFEGKLELKN